MKEKSLKEKAFSGLSWSTADKLFQQLFVLIAGILLARTIDKENYGLIGVLAIFTALANILQESGFTSALIRKREVSQADYVTVFYTNIGVGTFLYLLLFFMAPLIGHFHDKPILIPLARFIFLSFLFNSFGVIQNVKFIKELNYKLPAKINLFAVTFSYIIALVMASRGYAVWALATQMVSISFFKTTGLWIMGKWKPSGSFNKNSFLTLFGFSSKIVAGSALGITMVNIPQNLFASFYTFGVTGLYNQAFRNFNTIMEFLSGSVHSVSYPVLSAMETKERLKNGYRKFVRIKGLIIFPLFMGVILVAKPFMAILGEQWEDAAPILQILCIGGIFSGLDTCNTDILRLKGKSGKMLLLITTQAIFIFTMVCIPLFVKLPYLYYVAGLSASYLLKYILSTGIANRYIDYQPAELLKDLFPYFCISVFSVSCGYLFHYFIRNPYILLFLQIFFVAILYILIVYLSGSKILREAINMLKSKSDEN